MARVGRNASCGLPPHWFPRPRAEKRDNGRSMVAQLSRPWSNSSPGGGREREGGEGMGKKKGRKGRGEEGREVHVCLYNCLDPQVSTTAGYGGGKREEEKEGKEKARLYLMVCSFQSSSLVSHQCHPVCARESGRLHRTTTPMQGLAAEQSLGHYWHCRSPSHRTTGGQS